MANKRRPQGDGTIRKRSDGRWEARIIIGHKNDGSPMYKSAFAKTQRSALKQLHQLLDLYRDVDLTEECRMTLGEWMDKWMDEYMIFTIKENTIKGYRSQIDHQIKPFIGHKQLASLTTADIQKFYNKIKKEGRVHPHPIHGHVLSDSMVRKIHMMLHEAMEVAVRERYIVRNPTDNTTIPKKTTTEKQVLDDSQLNRFLEAIQGEPYWHDFFYVEVMTGLRRGEICGIKWSDIDFNEGTLCIKRSVSTKEGGGVSIGETKTDAGVRTIIMPPSVATLLWKKRSDAINEWVFPHYTNPSDPLHPSSAYKKLKTLLKRLELPLLRFHDLRHTFATQATDGGVDPKTLAGILGHTDASFTLDTYTHVTSDMQRGASAIVNNMMQQFLITEENNGEQ
ncbi:MAG: site-specific integrase [Clostridia bacterium]|nr:site-specific integrase [Clostridia bacterium]